ncbi:MAG: hypothetical protein PF444_02920 [Bacteroidales bacterium]|jgi:DNA-directed RNA polymerase subunit RPC12/RpoP|nr:hypothetical protein [Bacteroidales bacterium]
MKIVDSLQSSPENDVIRCPQCSSVSLEASSHINVPEWKQGQTNTEETEFETTYICQTCGHHFSKSDLETRKTFNQGMTTFFFIFIMIVLLLIVLL